MDIAIFTTIVVGLTEVIKRAGTNKRYLPLVAIAFGIIGNLSLHLTGETTAEIIFNGIMIGLTAVGIWETSKHSVLGKK